MTLALYMDHHMMRQIVAGLRSRGLDVVTAYEDGADQLADEQLLERAASLGRVLCTQDKDFYRITHRWWNANREFPGVIHVDQDAVSIGRLIEDIALIAESYTPEEMANRLVYVPL